MKKLRFPGARRGPSKHVQPVEWLARAGYGARGLVYIAVGALAVMAAFEFRRSAEGAEGALHVFAGLPFGRVGLALLAGGLAGFVLWRIAQAAFDADRQGGSKKALANRAGQGISALIYTALALTCAGVAVGLSRSGGGSTASLLALPFGELLLAGVGVGVLIAGGLNVLHGMFGGFGRRLICDPEVRGWTVPLARAGYFVRGLVFLALGVFLVEAAFDLAPAEAATVEGALQMLERQPFGTPLLALAGAGLVAFGLFGLVEARYRRIIAPEPLRPS